MRPLCFQSPLRTLIFATLFYLFAPVCARAQAQSPYLYASIPGGATSQVAAFSVNLSGTLTPVPGSPFPASREGGLVAIDPTDRFLFVLDSTSNSISVLAIDPNTGALAEISGSPVATPQPVLNIDSPTPAALCMATFKGGTANYLYVAYQTSTTSSRSLSGAIVGFQIGTTVNPLTMISITNLKAIPVDIAISQLGYLYAALQAPLSAAASSQSAGVGVFAINPSNGQLASPYFANFNPNETSVAINPAGTLLFDGAGTSPTGLLESEKVLSDGSLTPTVSSLSQAAPNSPPWAMLVDGTGQLLYVQQGGQAAVYVINPSTGALTTEPLPIPEFSVALGNTVADPVEPFLYTLHSAQIRVFEIVDFTSGMLRELPGSPYAIPIGSNSLALTHNAATQTAMPRAAQLVPSAISFDETPVGQSVSDSTGLLTNTGTQSLSVAPIAVTGADQSSFIVTQNCPTLMLTHTSCQITITFKPIQTGALQATLTVVDDAGTQSMLLTGIGGIGGSGGSGSGGSGGSGSGGSGSGGGGGGSGSGGSGSGGSGSGGSGSGGSGDPPPQPTISIAPPFLSFLSPAPGTAAPQQNITLTNSSATPLTISSVQIAGTNATDFTLAKGCATILASQSCAVGIVFTPGAGGDRSAILVVTDNAANSPQYISLNGKTQAEILTVSPGTTDGYSESISTGETATFSLKLTPTFSGTVTFSPCSGAPTTATCTVPATMTVIANQPAPFTVTVVTVASSPTLLFDRLDRRQTTPLDLTSASLAFAILSAFIFLRYRPRTFSFSAYATIAALLALTLFSASGCGGVSTLATGTTGTPTPQSQTYTITITPTAVTSGNVPVSNIQPIQLTLIVN